MEYGLITSVWSIEGVPLEESLRRSAALGIPRVEIFGRGHGDPRHLSEAEVRRCVSFLTASGVEVAAFTALLPTNPGAADAGAAASNWAYVQRVLEVAEAFGTKKVLHLSGEKETRASRRDAWDRSVDFARRCCEAAQDRGMVLLVELEPTVAALVRDLETLEAYRRDVDSPALKFNLDTGHLNVIRAGPDELQPILDHVVHVHLSDNRGVHDAHEDLGSGSTDLAGYVARLLSSGIDDRCAALGLGPAVASIELHYGLVPPFARRPADESARRAWAYVQDGLRPRAERLRDAVGAKDEAPIPRHEETS